MNAAEARKITEANSSQDDDAGLRLSQYGLRLIENAAKNGESKVTNPFLRLRGMYSHNDRERAYQLLSEQGYTINKLGDSNVVISW